MSYFANLGVEAPVSEGAVRADRALEAAATFFDALDNLLDVEDPDITGAFLRVLALAQATGKTAMARSAEGEGRRQDHFRQDAVNHVARVVVAEAEDRNAGHGADLLYAARVMYADEMGPQADLTGLERLEDVVRPQAYVVPKQMT